MNIKDTKFVDITFLNITNNILKFDNKIKLFIKKLDFEKAFFDLDVRRVKSFELVMVAIDDDKVIGISGLEKKFGMVRSTMMISSKYHGKGLGKKFMLKLLDEAKNNGYSLIMGVVDEQNIGALKMDFDTGYKQCGKRENLYYIFRPLNVKGMIVFKIIKLLFPLVKMVDLVRR